MSVATTAVKERPILFSGPMVRAILEGRKTQTRRVVSPQPKKSTIGFSPAISGEHWIAQWVFDARALGRGRATMNGDSHRCPFAPVGSRLWVREAWRVYGRDRNGQWEGGVEYRADQSSRMFADAEEYERGLAWSKGRKVGGWGTPIHMPRWASRLTLEITRVRVERLQAISEDDARSEGLSRLTKDGGRLWKFGIPDRDGLPGRDDFGWHWAEWHVDPRVAFRALWDSINAKRGLPWATNPWVWVIDFRRIEP